MRTLNSIACPAWALNETAQALLEQIIHEQPEPRTRNHRLPDIYGGYSDGTTRTYPGQAARDLRAVHEAAREEAMNANDRDAWVALGKDSADALIARVLAETALRVELPSELRRTGTYGAGFWS